MTCGRTAAISCVIAVSASLVLARIHPFGNAGLYGEEGVAKPIMEGSFVPPEVRSILADKCADCHSNETRAPLYGWLAPASWLMERDIIRGRQAMNLALWNSYSADRQQTLAVMMVHETREHKMPLLQYRLIHWGSRITDADLRTLVSWAHISSGSSLGSAETHGGDGDPSRGQALFEKRCVGCHALEQNREGPKLQGVYGRAAGSVTDFAYSPALRKTHVVWDESSLDKWLTDPDAFIPGNEMDFQISKPQERQDLIAFLRQVGGK
jgi:cytochrome c